MKQTEHYYVVKGTVAYDEHGAFTGVHFEIDHETGDAKFPNSKTIYIPSEDTWVSPNQRASSSIAYDDDLLTVSLIEALSIIEKKEHDYA